MNLSIYFAAACGFTLAWVIQAFRTRACTAEQRTRAELFAAQVRALQEELSQSSDMLLDTRAELSRKSEELEQREARFASEREAIARAQAALLEQFKAISYEALEKNGKELVSLLNDRTAQHLAKLTDDSAARTKEGYRMLGDLGSRIGEQIARADASVQELVKVRIATDEQIKQQLAALTKSSFEVGQEATKLRSVLTNSRVRGSWGQLQLRNVVEAAGMLERCDFYVEETAYNGNAQFRPDMRVRLPNDLSVLIDAKVPMSAYAQAVECGDPAERRTKMREHVSSLKNHIREMARRNYPAIPEFTPALPYTVIFLPNESLFYSAMEADGELLSFAEEQRVILATPLSLIAFLRVVACGWTQVTVNLNAREIQDVAHTLHERLAAFMSDVAAVGEGLEGAVQSFNRAVGRRRNMEASFRKLRELGVGDGEQCTSVTEIDEEIRSFTPTPGHVSRIS